MSDSNVKRESERATAARREVQMHALAFSALRVSAGQLEAFASRLVEALSFFSAQSPDKEEADLACHARERLEQNKPTFQRLFNECLQQSLLQAAQELARYDPTQVASGAMDLSLDSFEVMRRKVLIDNLSQAHDALNADALAVLAMRIADSLGMASISPAQHPFRAEVFLQAAANAWGKFDPGGAAQDVVLRNLRPRTFLRLGAILDALNQELAGRGALPDAEERYRQQKASPPTPPAPTLRDKLRSWLAPEGTRNMIGERAVLLMDKMFDHVLGEECLAVEGKTMLTQLKLPLQEAVLRDSEAFFVQDHPLRRLLDSVIDLALAGKSGADDPLYRALARAIGLVQQAERPADVFERISDELRSVLVQEDNAQEARIQSAGSEALAEETQAEANRRAVEDVTLRLESGEVPGFLEVFLQEHWSRVLTHAYLMQDSRPDMLPAMSATMDDLIWSVKPKPTPGDRKDLIGRLPALLASVNTWLNLVQWVGEERERFFAVLAQRHASCMRIPAETTARDALESRMNIMQRASEHQLMRREREQKKEALAPCLAAVSGLKRGDWVRFVRNDGSKVNCRVVWISPKRQRFIFTGNGGRLLFTLGDEALAQGMRAGRVSLIEADRIVERALTQALNDLGIA